MLILDAGHDYLLDSLDGGDPIRLTFVKREGENFPHNSGTHPGTNMQEVLRAMINRARYLNEQKPSMYTQAVIGNLESALVLMESRAAGRHHRQLDFESVQHLVFERTCDKCKHVGCDGSCH